MYMIDGICPFPPEKADVASIRLCVELLCTSYVYVLKSIRLAGVNRFLASLHFLPSLPPSLPKDLRVRSIVRYVRRPPKLLILLILLDGPVRPRVRRE